MPELPEVETIRIGLQSRIVGRVIASTHNYDSPKSFPNDPQTVRAYVCGARVIAVRRRAKILLIELSTNYTLMTHLKMTGQLVFIASPSTLQGVDSRSNRWGGGHPNDSLVGCLPDRTTRQHIQFSDGSRLYFNDVRKFGWMQAVPTPEVANTRFMQRVGPEPLDDSFTSEQCIQRMRRRNGTTIKAALLDQTVLAGVGNIYADESLWAARIHPATRVRDVTSAQLTTLHKCLRSILQLAINKGGSTDKNYIDVEGRKGAYLQYARVFRRDGQPCSRCHTRIEKIRVAGRGTHICPLCQQV